ncbi:MAG: integrase, partial [Mariprofundaceae bacterium]
CLRRQRTVKGFEKKYTRVGICLLADVDRVVDDLSGSATKIFCQRALEVYGDQRLTMLAGVCVSHIYKLKEARNIIVTVANLPKPGPPVLISANGVSYAQMVGRDTIVWSQYEINF